MSVGIGCGVRRGTHSELKLGVGVHILTEELKH